MTEPTSVWPTPYRFMDAGQIIETGAPEDVLMNPRNQRTQDFIAAVLN